MRKITLLVVIALAILAVVSGPVAAHGGRYATDATSGNDSGTSSSHNYQWSTDGCSYVPDSAPGLFYFNHPCDHHDGCYGGHWESRSGCDGRFWTNMNSACNYNWSWWNPARYACREVRDTYYLGVRAFGAPAYYNWSIFSAIG